MIFRRGKQPSAVDCLIHENVAVVIARLAINAAMLAMMKTGQKAPPTGMISQQLNSALPCKHVNKMFQTASRSLTQFYYIRFHELCITSRPCK